jgi:hypothetical protein
MLARYRELEKSTEATTVATLGMFLTCSDTGLETCIPITIVGDGSIGTSAFTLQPLGGKLTLWANVAM